MKHKSKILNLSLAIVCAILYSFFLRSLVTNVFWAIALVLMGLLSFLLFFIFFMTLSEIIKKKNIRYNLCTSLLAISALIFITSLVIGIISFKGIGVTPIEVNINIILITTFISLIFTMIFALLSSIFEKNNIQNKNEH